MSSGRIALTAQMTANLLSLQSTAKLLGTTQERLATGKKVNSAIDDPVAYFDSEAHYQLASDYETFQNGMSEAVQTAEAATTAIESVKSLLQQMKSIATSAKSGTTTEMIDYIAQFNTLIEQANTVVDDAEYKGVNLLKSADELEVVFDVNDNSLTISGFSAAMTGLGVVTVDSAGWSTAGDSIVSAGAINSTIAQIDAAIDTLRTKTKVLATNLAIVTERQTFTDEMIAVLNTGGDNLTLADTNEEGANMLMLQTRQSLGIQSLSIASQSAQAVLSLFQ